MLEANLPVDGITCIAPTALAGETTRCFQPDSCQLTASASSGSTPYRFEVLTIRLRIWERVGSLRLLQVARLRLACATTWSAYVRPAKVLFFVLGRRFGLRPDLDRDLQRLAGVDAVARAQAVGGQQVRLGALVALGDLGDGVAGFDDVRDPAELGALGRRVAVALPLPGSFSTSPA